VASPTSNILENAQSLFIKNEDSKNEWEKKKREKKCSYSGGHRL
jgi:hypothetical protein